MTKCDKCNHDLDEHNATGCMHVVRTEMKKDGTCFSIYCKCKKRKLQLEKGELK